MSDRSQAAGAPPAVPDTGAAMLMLIAGLLALQPLATDFYLASLPALTGYFGVPASAVQLTLSVFIAGFAGAQLVAGPLSDRFGRRPVVVWGCALFTIASVAGAFAPSLAMLVVARFVQSLGVCCTVICARALVRDSYEPELGARVMARALGWMSVAPLFGPIAGGFLQDALGWRVNFAALALLGGALLVATVRRLPETNRHLNPHATDLGPLFANYRRIAATPAFWRYTLPVTGSYCALFSFLSASPFAVIRVLGVPERYFGFVFGACTAGFLVGTMVTRRLLPRLGLERTVRRGALVALGAGAALAAFALAGVETLPTLVVPVFFLIMAHGLLQPTCQMGAIGPFPREAGAAAALVGFVMHLAAALVGWWIGASHDGTLRPLSFTIAALGAFIALSAFALVRAPARGAAPAA